MGKKPEAKIVAKQSMKGAGRAPSENERDSERGSDTWTGRDTALQGVRGHGPRRVQSPGAWAGV